MSSTRLTHLTRSAHGRPAVVTITSAPMDPEQAYAARRRRYAFMMSTRIACVIAAVLISPVSLLAALGLMVAGAVLPWCAVLIANDRLPAERPTRPQSPTRRAIAAPAHPTIEL